jgi:small-conductance mechanosensitive channel
MRDRIVPTSYKVIRWIIITLTVLVVLQVNGIDLTSMFTGLGVVSIIAGLALQDLFKDVIMGMHIMSHHFFQVGDIVQIGDFEGRIVEFNLQTTKLESTLDLSIRTVCNREITQATISSDIVDFRLPLSYDLKVDEVDAIMADILDRASAITDLKKITFEGTDEFADSAIYYRLRLITPPAKRYAVMRKLRRIIQLVLEDHNTSIPYNHLDVHTY